MSGQIQCRNDSRRFTTEDERKSSEYRRLGLDPSLPPLDSAYLHCESRQTGLGQRFRDEVDRAVSRIVAEPSRWAVYRERYRRVRLKRFPFALFYRQVDADRVLILAVAHDHRRPGYWIRRSSRP